MIRHLRALNARIQAWLDYTLVTDAPAGHTSVFDELDRPAGEIPPTSTQRTLAEDQPRGPLADWGETYDRLWDDIVRGEDGPR